MQINASADPRFISAPLPAYRCPRSPLAHPSTLKPTETSHPASSGSSWEGHATRSQLRLHFKFPTWLHSCRLPLAAAIPTAFPARVLAGCEYSPTTHSLHVAHRQRRQLPCSWPWVSCETCRHAGNSLPPLPPHCCPAWDGGAGWGQGWGGLADVAGSFWGERPVPRQACAAAAGAMGRGR